MPVNMTVKARNGAIVYDQTGTRIPEDQFVTVPLSATLVRAVKLGDLEEAEEDKPPKKRAATRRTAASDESA